MPRLPWKASIPPLRSLPLLSEGADFVLESPGVARLLIELPIGFGDGGGAHQAVRIEILERLRAFAVGDQLAHPFGVDARIDHEMGDMDVLGTELARDRLRHRA